MGSGGSMLKLWFLGMAMMFCFTVYAQEDVFPQYFSQFSFSPPGARSLAMGGAFIGAADDATASEANPAGSMVLTKPEVSVHFRYSKFENEIPLPILPLSGRFSDSTSGPSFASLVIPWDRIAVSTYFHQASHFQSHADL